MGRSFRGQGAASEGEGFRWGSEGGTPLSNLKPSASFRHGF